MPESPPKLSIAIIAHNEGTYLADALQSVSWADQVVVVDCGSTDNTSEIAEGAGAEVYREPNRSNLNENKNIAIGHCRGEWIFVLDADERIPDMLAGEIRRVINDNKTDGFLVPRRNHIIGRWLRHGSQYPDYQLRLFKRDRGNFPAVHVHERLNVNGRIDRLSEPFDHHPYPDLSMLIHKNLRYSEFEAQHLFQQGKTISFSGLIWRIMVKTPLRFLRRYVLKMGFRDGVPGLIMAWFDAENQSLRWIRLWELSRKLSDERERI